MTIENLKTIPFDISSLRSDFPILNRKINGKPLVYFDNGATAQKPLAMLEALDNYYTEFNSNIHRGVHQLSQEATSAYEEARMKVREFLNIALTEEVIFTSGTTDSINLVASTYGRANINEGDEILITEMEHHSNIVPWQMLCDDKKAILRVAGVLDDGSLDMEHFTSLLSPRTKLVAVSHISNVLGTINPIKEIVKLAHQQNALVLVDGAQAVQHSRPDIRDLDCDFYAFSAHKMFGPTGVGVLFGKKEILDAMPPYKGGGEMISEVTFEKTSYNELPYKFEAGTPNIAGGIALMATLDYLDKLDFEAIHDHENMMYSKLSEGLNQIEGIRMIGTANDKIALASFVIEGLHHYDIGMLLDQTGIAVRTGHNCAQPLMKRFGISGTVRASLAMYNTAEEVERFMEAMDKAVKMLR